VAARVLSAIDPTSLTTSEQRIALTLTQSLVNRSLELGAATRTTQKAAIRTLSNLVVSGIFKTGLSPYTSLPLSLYWA
jgi:hypothetical protein